MDEKAKQEQIPVIRLDRQLKYEGNILKIYEDVVLANGHKAHWDFIHHDGAAAVLPVADDGRILMVRQYRNALDRFTLEIPAGKLDDPNEPKIQCAYRELEEETGFRVDQLEYLMSLNTTVAFCDEAIDIFVAHHLIPSKQHLDEDEVINVEPWELKDLEAMIYAGEITDGKTIAAIMAYARKYRSEDRPDPRTPESLLPDFDWAKVPRQDIALPRSLLSVLLCQQPPPFLKPHLHCRRRSADDFCHFLHMVALHIMQHQHRSQMGIATGRLRFGAAIVGTRGEAPFGGHLPDSLFDFRGDLRRIAQRQRYSGGGHFGLPSEVGQVSGFSYGWH